MATIKDVAKEAGVSVATVSRVVNKSPKASKAAIESVNAAMQKLGYRPNANARALVSKSTNTIGVMVGDVSDPFFGSLLKAVDTVAQAHQKHLLIGNGYHDATTEKEAIDLLINNRCESLVIHSKGLSDQELLQFAKEVPGLVIINRHIPEMADRCISLDNQHGANLATEHLIAQGHTKIAYINSEHDIDDSHHRKAGYQQALHAHGINFNEEYCAEAQPTDEGGEQAMIDLLSRNLPITAVVCYNDYMAAGALSALEKQEIAVPKDISLMGFDNGLIAKYLHPKLSTIDYPIQTMAKQAAELSLALVSGNSSMTKGTIFQASLIERSSVIKQESPNS
ncbi:substrate-binding domain-containing protein [Aliivibrio sp. S4TY2]|uniref:substrate-binding domain-containing protein n=1 Tax=unclassified Aliivibrio TaxID=2645654 RepID=UPI002378C42A|nr:MULTISPECIES: substrate-binding domain-containing protein [unclassified Aliivibrio]MDD9156769.1 substrate-binding domain-containing protein [Aliivibrio sp. S4TY2]MDD9160255.1 substrate-binding domain-containing protein [Aliivibrio sp. S4TY1]MDD9164452.1 substrate-binding domain-containing protein [Aliivibrio sp. S4MY2]MDD9168678.1 substrate-binding domain-containing protein [Aliivibrio sp. S4MY4]MDD9184787.1 substrate-binding domain-containing protein [Aliivibrio sp. S4MY3]